MWGGLEAEKKKTSDALDKLASAEIEIAGLNGLVEALNEAATPSKKKKTRGKRMKERAQGEQLTWRPGRTRCRLRY